MATFKMPSKCSVCKKRCDGNIWCSEECKKAEQKTHKDNAKVLGDFFKQF